MNSIGFSYKKSGTARNFIDTPNIKSKRAAYIRHRYSERFKDHLFVWQDESYVNRYHVKEGSWFRDGDTVLRKNKGQRYIIVHAGCKEGWICNPKVWVANSGRGDYHENMNSGVFHKYLRELCQSCEDQGREKVVFVLDNAKYHKCTVDDREDLGPNRPSLSQMNKGELIDLLLR